MSNAKLTLSEESKSKPPDEVFELLEQIGKGSYATVFKGVKRETGETCAIKKVSVQNGSYDIYNEINIMTQCRCENIVQFYCNYFHNSEMWIVMEYFGGGSISDIMKKVKRTLNEKEIASVLKDTLEALNYLHYNQLIIHRDVKAGNILLNDEGQAKLADFGVAVRVKEGIKVKSMIGTPLWWAPEVAQNKEYDHLVDIWSLGVTAIEIAQGKPPHNDLHTNDKDIDKIINAIIDSPAPSLKNFNEWSHSFNDFISHCLTKNPEMRYNSSDLLKHNFISNAPNPCILKSIIEDAKRERQKAAMMRSLDSVNRLEYKPNLRETSTSQHVRRDIDPAIMLQNQLKDKDPRLQQHQEALSSCTFDRISDKIVQNRMTSDKIDRLMSSNFAIYSNVSQSTQPINRSMPQDMNVSSQTSLFSLPTIRELDNSRDQSSLMVDHYKRSCQIYDENSDREPKYQNYRDLSESSTYNEKGSNLKTLSLDELNRRLNNLDFRYLQECEKLKNRFKIKIEPILKTQNKKGL